ncbi:MAG TPA: FAD-binding protein [Acidimicrobiales bacterium]|nr:FAD-binding protein [Acidimicrobiales bacterium]
MRVGLGARLVAELTRQGVHAIDNGRACTQASRDYSWLSPVLAGRLPPLGAEAVAYPQGADELAAVISTACRMEVPLTLRGRGTGNYAQAVPLLQGLVVDLTRMSRVLSWGEGFAWVEPGLTCSVLEKQARTMGQELALYPSTTFSTLGGFLGGGAGGAGSIENGLVWDGFVSGLQVAACRQDPSLHLVRNGATRPFLHSYGTTGVIIAAKVALRPATDWSGLLASFAAWEPAVAAAQHLLGSEVRLRFLGVTDAELACLLACPNLAPGLTSLRAVVETRSLQHAISMLKHHGGQVDAYGPSLVDAVTFRSFNHVTLRAKRQDPGLCHLQVAGDALIERSQEVRRCLARGQLHLDAMTSNGTVGFGGLLLGSYLNEARLYEAMTELKSVGVEVVNPHTWLVNDPDGSMATMAALMDPAGLLNPGKLQRMRNCQPAH